MKRRGLSVPAYPFGHISRRNSRFVQKLTPVSTKAMAALNNGAAPHKDFSIFASATPNQANTLVNP
jgi:hypothetical protein